MKNQHENHYPVAAQLGNQYYNQSRVEEACQARIEGLVYDDELGYRVQCKDCPRGDFK